MAELSAIGGARELAGPVSDRERFVAMDALRGVALCGIMLINIAHMGVTWSASAPLSPPDAASADWITWWIAQLFVEGTMRGIFGLLFGAGVVLLVARGAEASLYFRRNLWLMAFGFIHGTLLLWPGDILFSYGLAAIFLFPLRDASPRALIAAAVAIFAFLALGGGLSGWEARAEFREGLVAEAAAAAGEELSEEQNDALGALADARDDLRPSADALAQERAARLGGYGDNVALSTKQFFGWQIASPFMLVVLLENLATMMLGMALAKLGAFQSRWSSARYGALVLFGYGVGITVNAFEAGSIWASAFAEPVWHESATYELSRVPTTLGHLGLFMLLWRALPHAGFAPFAALGRMALSNYLGQSLLAALLFFGFGFGLFGALGWAALWGVAAAILIAQAVFSMGWLSQFRFGPLEWVWRSLTYARAQPFSRSQGPAA